MSKQKLTFNPDGSANWVSDQPINKAPPLAVDKPCEGEALGCIESQVEVMRADAKMHGFTDIEFVEDRDVEGWYNARFSNQNSQERYARHCGLTNNACTTRAVLAPEHLQQAQDWAFREYPRKEVA